MDSTDPVVISALVRPRRGIGKIMWSLGVVLGRWRFPSSAEGAGIEVVGISSARGWKEQKF